ncbi:hypothetical protein J0H58_29375 [bacterium]|nr:hypothetical protein [bacterium]
MVVLVCCPKCRFEGALPDDDPGGTIACPKCGTEFAPGGALPADATAVWVGTGAPPGVTPPPLRKGANPLPTGAAGRPVEITPSNAGKHLDWMKNEVARFDAYVARQLEVLRKRRDELAAAESAAANALVARDLQGTREKAALEADRAALAAEREGLTRRAEALDRAERSLQRRLAEVE